MSAIQVEMKHAGGGCKLSISKAPGWDPGPKMGVCGVCVCVGGA